MADPDPTDDWRYRLWWWAGVLVLAAGVAAQFGLLPPLTW